MRYATTTLAAALCAAVIAFAGPASANLNPTKYEDAVAFHALGVITQLTNFDSYVEGDITYIGDPYTVGQLTFTSTQNSVFGKHYPGYGNVRNALVNNILEPMNVAIGGSGYNLFSFQIGDLVGDADVTLWIDTNLDSFGFGLGPYPSNEGFKFYGFLAPDGQYFTGFHFSANDAVTAPAFSEFELGHTGPACNTRVCTDTSVPEPRAWALLILGFGAVGATLRTHRRLRARPAG